MTARPLFLAAAALALTGCQEMLTRTADYEPQRAGSVDQAMCLLGFTAVPLRELLTGHHLVEVQINGKTGSFVLDTGANATVLHEPFAAELGITGRSAGPAGAVGLGGSMKASQARIESMRIGPVPIRQTRVLTTDLAQVVKLLGPLSGGRIYGIIGQDVMKEHRAVIDVAKPILYLVSADRAPSPQPLKRCQSAPDGSEKAERPEAAKVTAGKD